MKEHSEGKQNRARFIQLVTDIEKVMDTYRTRLVAHITKPNRPRIIILTNLVFSEISDIVIILKMICRCMEELRLLDERIMELRKRVPDGTVDRSTPEGDQFFSAVTRQHEANSELEIYIKTTYEWLYHVMDLVRSHPAIRSLVEKSTCWNKLRSHCEFRNKLIAHKKGIKVITMGGIRYSARDFHAEIVLMPFVPPASAVKELASLFVRCASVLTTDEANEKNFFERCKILFRNLDKLTNNTAREQVVSFVRRYGTISAQPIELAEFMRDLAKNLMPKLATLRNV